MPPRKRTRASAASSRGDNSGPSAKKSKKPVDGLPALPPKPVGDTYEPANEETKEAIALKIEELISNTSERLKIGTVGQFQLRLSVSNTEGDLLLGEDGKSNVENIQKQSNAILLITDKISGGVDREVIITGGIKEIITATARTSYFLANALEIGTGDTTYHVTLYISNNLIETLTAEKLKEMIPSIDVSSVCVPFSNYQSVYLYGRIPQLMSSLAILLENVASISKQQLLKDFPPEQHPVIGLQSGEFIRSEINQRLLDKSKQSLAKYLSQDYKGERPQQVDPKIHTQKQIEEAIRESQKKSKTLETLKHAIDVPIDFISSIIGKNGLKITEIRSKSNSNVIIDDQIKNEHYRVVTVTGLPESNMIALQYIAGLIV